ncbi:MAG TPA: hypothetical protein VLD37_01140 [Candidatus Bilamarchaeum sp.]|nr:hypothetical protein [Candidatus Bilamarchaeum sp.]
MRASKARAQPPSMTLSFSLNGQTVLVDRIESFDFAHGIVAKIETERCIRSLTHALQRKGEDSREIERVIRKLVSSDRLDLSSICDFLDTALMFADRLDKPVQWIELISSRTAMETTHSQRSMRSFQLFEEARTSQGTPREQILIKSLESGI